LKVASPNTPVSEPKAAQRALDAPLRLALNECGLIVLTQDAALLAMLKRVSEASHPVSVVGSEVDLSTQLLAQHPGVAVLDCAALATSIVALTQRLQAQFPELVLIVAGSADEQGLVAAQITDGSVHRFLHKPFSEQRVRLFVESAWKRQEQSEALPEIRAPARRGAARSSSARLWLALIVLIALAVPLAWYGLQLQHGARLTGTAAAPADASADAALEQLLARADAALAAGHLVSPANDNAVALYREALQRSPNDPRAINGIEQVIEQLLSGADAQLQQHQLDAAQQLVEQARAISPHHPRVAFLAAQIGAQRERVVLSKAQHAVAGGNAAGALAALGGSAAAQSGEAATAPAAPATVTASAPGSAAPPAGSEAPPATASAQSSAPAAAAPGGASGVADYLARGRAALSRGQLIEPLEDNARFYIAAARALNPNDPDVQAATLDLIARLSSEARQAVAAGDIEQAEIWTGAAAEAGAEPETIAALRGDISTLRTQATAAALTRLQGTFRERLEQGHLIEPATDSAKFYLGKLSATDANSAITQQARATYAQRTLEEARSALQGQDLAAARRWLAEARAAGADGAEVGTLDAQLGAAQQQAQQADNYVNESELTRTRYIAPKFPALASQHNISGWVDLQFLIGTDGTVSDAAIVGAQPAGVFEQAALDAVRHWRYQPVQRDGHTVSQHARVRVRFAVQS
jgi:TonB family protein